MVITSHQYKRLDQALPTARMRDVRLNVHAPAARPKPSDVPPASVTPNSGPSADGPLFPFRA